VDHVHLEAPPGLNEDLTWFYGEVAELDFLGDVAPDAGRLCFKSEQIELRIRIKAEPRIEPIGCNVVILVPSMDAALGRLDERKRLYQRLSGLAFTDRRLGLLDPAGNRIELKQEWPPVVY
jgi:hypothetical protein